MTSSRIQNSNINHRLRTKTRCDFLPRTHEISSYPFFLLNLPILHRNKRIPTTILKASALNTKRPCKISNFTLKKTDPVTKYIRDIAPHIRRI